MPERIGSLIGERAQQHGVSDAEYCGARADAERNRDHGSDCEDRIFSQHAESIE